MQINITDAKSKLSALVVAAERGEQVVLCRGGKPVAQITSLVPQETASPLRSIPALAPQWDDEASVTESLPAEDWGLLHFDAVEK